MGQPSTNDWLEDLGGDREYWTYLSDDQYLFYLVVLVIDSCEH